MEIAIDDPGLLYGATVFTTLRVYENYLEHDLTNWNLHVSRLNNSLKIFGWQQPNWKHIREGAEMMLHDFPILRITIFPDGREWVTGRNFPPNLAAKQTQGITASLISPDIYRSLPQHKTGNYLACWLAKTNDSQEGIFQDTANNWLETTTGSLWGWKDDCLWTPPLDKKILPGVMRSHILNKLENQKQPVSQEPWTPELVSSFNAIAYSNCVVEIVPIHTVINGTSKLTYNPQHPCLQQLRQLFSL
ncbi:aminotransferase class IV [Calothrix sp. PCC 6303]|uniref:aminotransferase class IV n=1 Tax=Calothrix sp. PCC 6303 TaxID=1170562 RepID=UPI00031BAD32|nr:aminotransferase class IV [Calothrix sp. PCC 6303]